MSDGSQLSRVLLALLFCLGAAAAGAEELIDPTRPPQAPSTGVQAEAPLPPWKLQAILQGAERCVAVIDGRPLTEGGRLGEARLLRIQPDRVLLRYQGQTVELKLPRVEGVRKRNHQPEGKP